LADVVLVKEVSMIVIATIPGLVAIIGALAYALSGNAKVAELGRIAFAFGLFVVLLTLAHAHL
jgi:hypothetical protein